MSKHIVVGLGNPGGEYTNTRHNTGRMLVERLHEIHDFGIWKDETKKPKMLWAKGAIGGSQTTLVLPNTMMNNSGTAVAHFVKNKKDAGNTIVVYDDMDLPLGVIKISHDRGSGGHNGIKSLERGLKTRAFVRVRIGVSPASAKGVAKKPAGEERVLKFLLGKFAPGELAALKKIFVRAAEAVEHIIEHGYQSAMTEFN